MSIGIYKITNKQNNKSYVGQSIVIEERWDRHKYSMSYKDKQHLPLYRALNKYGINNFEFSILEECQPEELNDKEIFWIKKLNTLLPNGYNCHEGGNGGNHIIIPEYVINITNDLLSNNYTREELSKKYNVALTTISSINTGKHWYRDDIKYPICNLYSKSKPNKQIKQMKKEVKYCKCGKEIDKRSKLCPVCEKFSRRKAVRPEPLELARMICESSFAAVGRKFGVSNKAIHNWCKDYGIPHTKKELKIWYQNSK